MSGRYRSAVAAYVRGHDRVWTLDRMRGADSEHRGDGETEVGSEADPIEWSAPPSDPSIGVGVASALEFHRGPGRGRGGEVG